jgi:hypothetical protein
MIHLFLFAVLAAGEPQTVLVEAEQFSDFGGWVHDSQFMDQMGSPYLLAHGLGVPVADAATTVEFPASGTYRVWVRTRDWVATWNAPGAPGRFQVLVDGRALETVFGTASAQWVWQDGGQVEIGQRTVRLALRDLTGFAGRCDALLFTTDEQLAPPNADPEMAAFRRRLLGLPEDPEPSGEFDLVVVGGGIAGTCAAISAARLGLQVALVQDRPVLGGNNSSEVRVWLQGARNIAPWPRVGDVVAELEQRRSAHYGPDNKAELYEDDKKLDLVRAEKNIRLMLDCRVNAAEVRDGKIQAVIAQDTYSGRRHRLAGRWFADCTGDAALGFLAGAEYDMTLPGHMGRCNLWNVIDTGQPTTFPQCEWALDLTDKPFPGRSKDLQGILSLGGWYWESGFDHEPIAKGESIRDWNFRAMYGAWDALKNVDRAYPNHKLNWAAHISGKRESRRLLGDVVLSKEDLLKSKSFPDGCVPTGWPIDLHLADPRYEKGFEGDGFIAKAYYTQYPRPYWIPYRCLYSRNIANLFMAGRDISVTHEALGATRVMRTGGCMGEIVGMAAAICKQHGLDPRGVYPDYLEALQALMTAGVGRPVAVPGLENVGRNVARTAAVVTSGDKDPDASPAALVHDGLTDVRRNELRWLSHARTPNWVEFAWDQPQRIAAARVISGYCEGSQVVEPIESFVLQSFEAGDWKDVPGTDTAGNREVVWQVTFEPITAGRLRLLVRTTKIDVSRIWEVELYEPAGLVSP